MRKKVYLPHSAFRELIHIHHYISNVYTRDKNTFTSVIRKNIMPKVLDPGIFRRTDYFRRAEGLKNVRNS